MATVSQSNIGLLHNKLTVNLEKNDYLPAYNTQLKNYAKNANIPGFRKGMVPVGLIKKQVGSSVLYDVVFKEIEKNINDYLVNEKVEIFGQPIPLDNEIKLDAEQLNDLSFDFEIGLKPTVTLEDISKISLTNYKIEITDKIIDEEVTQLRKKLGESVTLDTVSNEEDSVDIMFEEVDANNVIIDTTDDDKNVVINFSFKDLSAPMQSLLKGKKQGENVIFQLAQAFDGAQLDRVTKELGFTIDEVQNASQKIFMYTVKTISSVTEAELNEDFYKKAYPNKEIKTEAELRQIITDDIQNYLDAQSKNQFHDTIYHHLVDNNKFELPETFLKRWLKNANEKQVKTEEEVEKEFPTFKEQLQWTLISDKLIIENKLQADEAELKAYLKNDVMSYFAQMGMGASLGEDTAWVDSYVDRMMKDKNQIDESYRKLVISKLFNHVEGQVKKNDKAISVEDFNKLGHKH